MRAPPLALALLAVAVTPRPAAASDCAAAAVQIIETAPPGPPHRLTLAKVELVLRDSQGKVVASTRPGPKEWMGPKPAQSTFVEHHFELPCLPAATYTLEARYSFRGERAPHTQALAVALGRGEIDLRIHLGFTARGSTGKPQLQLMSVTRLLPGVGVRLRPQWTPHPDAEARYVLENVGPKPLYGVATRGNFVGIVERFDPATHAFVEVTRGDVIPPGDPGQPVPPHGTRLVRENEIQGRPRPLAPGRYRFAVEYQTTPLATTLSPAEKRGATVVRLHERHRATVEFRIK